ncbi:MAG: glutamate--cysteine ligase, partial [Actinomycetes bacterium]
YFPALLPECEGEDPVEVLERGDTPQLHELRLHNGTIYRWNRPIYDVHRDRPHLRVENRVLPAGPTVADILANAAFYYGLVRVLCEADRPVWSQMSFSAAEDNFHAGARDGIDARLYWPGLGEVPAAELVLRRLLPMAHAGLESWGVEAADRERLLGMIEQRCLLMRTGASWQIEMFHRLYEERGMDRLDALREMTVRYRELMHSNQPVTEWPVEG